MLYKVSVLSFCCWLFKRSYFSKKKKKNKKLFYPALLHPRDPQPASQVTSAQVGAAIPPHGVAEASPVLTH